MEWFRGLVDGEGSFIINTVRSKTGTTSFGFRFHLFLHKDDAPMLRYIAQRLNVGLVYVYDYFVSYIVTGKNLLKIVSIIDKSRLNTSKHLNYLVFRLAYFIYTMRTARKVNF